MELDQAIRTVCEVHTRNDIDTGFTVMMGAVPCGFSFDLDRYVDAWEALRKHIKLPTRPNIKD